MIAWFVEHWYMVWGLTVVIATVSYRIRKRGGYEPLPKRIIYALVPQTDSKQKQQQQATFLSLILMAVGAVLVLAELLLIAVLKR